MAVAYRVDILTAAGARVGSGPVTSVSDWKVTRRMDRVGDWSFTMAATDPQRAQVTLKRKAAIYTQINNYWRYVGGGTIDRIEHNVQEDGRVLMEVSGADALRDLVYKVISGEYNASLSTILGLMDYPGWLFDGFTSYTGDLYVSFQYDTVLNALRRLSERAWGHFYLSESIGVNIVRITSIWTPAIQQHFDVDSQKLITWIPRALRARGDLDETHAAIISLKMEQQSYDLITRVYPLGAGNASPLTLAATSVSPPTGYFAEANYGYVQHTAGVAEYGVLGRVVQFKDIRPVAGTDMDVVTASNAMMMAAVFYLQEHAAPVTSYRIQLAEYQGVLRPMQYIHVDYRDASAGIAIDENMYILEATLSGTPDGMRTTDLVVSDAGRWPESDSGAVVENIAQSEVYQVHPQLNANSYVIPYTVPVDETNEARLRFRFDGEVLQVNRVTMDVRLAVFESTINAVGGTSTSTGPGSSHSHGISIPDHNHDLPFHTHSITVEQYSGTPDPVGVLHGSGSLSTFVYAGTSGNRSVTVSQQSSETTEDGSIDLETTDSEDEHTHDLTAEVDITYGIYRDSAGDLFDLEDDLEYSVDGTNWYRWATGINDYESLGDSWVRVDLTTLLTNTSTFRPKAANNNVRIRRHTTGAEDKRAMINAQINIRTIIQAVAFT